jgi:hypothetical protein
VIKMTTSNKAVRWTLTLSLVLFACNAFLQRAAAQDQDDPPGRVARLGYMQGSVSFQPAGESDWVEAVRNRPLTVGDKIWADRDSRAELSLGDAVIDLNANTGISFLNLDDRTIQIQLSSGSVNVRVRHLDRDDVFEIDTPNLAFSVYQPGRYRLDASEDGKYTVIAIREGEGEASGNGQSYTLHANQRANFEGTDSLHAEVDNIGSPDDFDNWAYGRDHRYENSPSAQYVSHDVVGYEDLDDNGDWRPDPGYGTVWYPHVAAGWAPYRDGHWAWIDPWGWTWVDDEPWGYAPFHYGRWISVRGRWGWIPGPREVRPVYAPALVVFVGGGGGFGGNVGWFPLGPREVYVPSYRVSPGYVNRVNVSNTTVNQTTVTNVYNTTIVNNNTTINNTTYVNRNVSGAVTAVPQRSFASAQPVSRSAVAVNAREVASAPLASRASVAPTNNSVLGAHANTANRVAAPPAAVANRAVIARATAPPPPVPFAARQQALAAHPGQPIARQEMQKLRPASAPAAPPQVRQVAATKPSTPPPAARPNNQPGNPASAPANRPGNAPAANQPANAAPANRPGSPAVNPAANQPANRPGNPAPNNIAEPNRPNANQPTPNQPTPNNRPQPNQPVPNQPRPSQPQPNQPQPNQPNNRPADNPTPNGRPPATQPNQPQPNQPNARPEPAQPAPNERPQPNQPQPNQPRPNQPQPNQPNNRPADNSTRNDRAPVAQPNNRPQPNQPVPNNRPAEQPSNDRPSTQPNNRPSASQPRNEPPPRQAGGPPSNDRPAPNAQTRPTQPPPRQQTPDEKKRQEDERKNQKPQ